MKMADQMEKSNQRQLQCENADEPEQKRQRPDECEGAANTMETKKITNIYYDCLERIFDFLDLESLLMVAQTCKRLQIAAAVKFGDEFGKKTIQPYRLYPREPEPEINVYQNEIRVFGLKLCLAFLRCFGAKISDLYIDFYYTHSKDGYVDQYINQYCADTLTSIEFLYKSQFSNEAFKKPFKNVEKVEIFVGDLENHLSNFINWFPNLRCLEMLRCSFDETATMNVSFPHLEHLELHIVEDLFNFRIEQAATLLQANPQLQSIKLHLRYELTFTTALDAIIANSFITKLQVVCQDLFVNVSEEELNRFATEHPLIVEIVLVRYRMAADDAINFIRRMKSSKRIEFQVKGRPECDRLLNQVDNEWKSEVLTTLNSGLHVVLNRG